MTHFAKLFRAGRDQAVRLPRSFRFKGDKVRIRRVGRAVILEPYVEDAAEWLAELKKIPTDPLFLKHLGQPGSSPP